MSDVQIEVKRSYKLGRIITARDTSGETLVVAIQHDTHWNVIDRVETALAVKAVDEVEALVWVEYFANMEAVSA